MRIMQGIEDYQKIERDYLELEKKHLELIHEYTKRTENQKEMLNALFQYGVLENSILFKIANLDSYYKYLIKEEKFDTMDEILVASGDNYEDLGFARLKNKLLRFLEIKPGDVNGAMNKNMFNIMLSSINNILQDIDKIESSLNNKIIKLYLEKTKYNLAYIYGLENGYLLNAEPNKYSIGKTTPIITGPINDRAYINLQNNLSALKSKNNPDDSEDYNTVNTLLVKEIAKEKTLKNNI